MTARCHKDTCTVHWSEVVSDQGRVFEADVPLDVSLHCDDINGVGVKLSSQAGNTLSIIAGSGPTDPLSGLFAGIADSLIVSLSDNPTNIAVLQNAVDGAPAQSTRYDWTNSTGRDVAVLVEGEMNFTYGILGPSHAFSYSGGNGEKSGRLADTAYDPTGAGAPTNKLSPFNAQLAMRVKADVAGAAANPTHGRRTAREGIGGMVNISSSTGAEQKLERVPFSFPILVPAGQVLSILGEAFYEGPSQTVNVLANPAGGAGLAGTGFELWNLSLLVIPS